MGIPIHILFHLFLFLYRRPAIFPMLRTFSFSVSPQLPCRFLPLLSLATVPFRILKVFRLVFLLSHR